MSLTPALGHCLTTESGKETPAARCWPAQNPGLSADHLTLHRTHSVPKESASSTSRSERLLVPRVPFPQGLCCPFCPDGCCCLQCWLYEGALVGIVCSGLPGTNFTLISFSGNQESDETLGFYPSCALLSGTAHDSRFLGGGYTFEFSARSQSFWAW